MSQPVVSESKGRTIVVSFAIRKLRKGHSVTVRMQELYKGHLFHFSQETFRDADPAALMGGLGVPYNPTPQRRRVVDEILAATAAEKQEAA